jgi:hypothetical protein
MYRRIIMGAIALTATLAPGARAADMTVAPGGLQAALNQADAGDTLTLTGTHTGTYTAPAYSGTVTITGPGTLKTFKLTGGANITVTRMHAEGFGATGTRNLTVNRMDFTVAGAIFDHTDGLRIQDSSIHDAWDGFVIDDANGFTITHNDCQRVPVASRLQSGDCIQMARTRDWRITNNYLHDQPNKPHVDAIEITNNNYDGLIAGNVIARTRGIIFTPGDNTPISSQYRMTVVNNDMAAAREFSFQGVRMVDARFLYNTATAGFVQFGGASSGNVAVGNLIGTLKVDPSRQATYLPVEDYNVAAAYGTGYRKGPHTITGKPTFVDPAAGNFRLKAGSLGIGLAESTYRPAQDITGATRKQSDVGAYAFDGTTIPDPEPSPTPSPSPTPTPTPTPPPDTDPVTSGKAHIIGDSYTFDMLKAGLTQNAPAGWKITASGVGGRGIGGTITPNGFNQVEKDKAIIATVNVVAIELGTNYSQDGTYWVSRLQNMVKQIRAINSKCRIVWVAPGNFSSNAARLRQRVADTLAKLSTFGPGFSVVRWDLAAADHPEWFSASDGFKHPRVDGNGDGVSDGYVALDVMLDKAVAGG